MSNYKPETWHVVTAENADDLARLGCRTTTEHILDVAHVAFVNKRPDGSLDVDTSVDMTAACKWDGCVHLHVGMSMNGDRDYVHICYLDAFIAELQKVRDMARAHFGDNGYWKPA